MRIKPLTVIIYTISTILCSHGFVEAEDGVPYREAIKDRNPLSLAGLPPRVANVLHNYYEKTYTDKHIWKEVESLRYEGEICIDDEVYDFVAFKKKPDYYKAVISIPNGGRVVMAYDGSDAWQLNTLEPDAEPVDMPADEAINFIRSAPTGGHLLYPQLKGKQIEFLGVSTVGDQRYFELNVTLPDGQVMRHMLDMATYAEVQQIAINHVSGDEEVAVYTEFRDVDGIRIPFKSTLFVDNEQVQLLRFNSVQMNIGVAPWMFTRPSGAYIPDRAMNPVKAMHSGESLVLILDSFKNRSEFEMSAVNADIWSNSVFNVGSDVVSEEEIQGIIRELGKFIDLSK